MKKIIIAVGFAVISTSASAQNYGFGTGSNPSSHAVQGYTRSNGTYVQPYHATNPDSTQRNNYGTSGNYNPYNGSSGHRGARY
jgi:uncharacterized protein YdeI (BOF family)